MKSNKLVALLTVFLALLLFVVMKPGDDPFLVMKIASITASVVLVGLFLYSRYLWRVPPFLSMSKMIDIGGKWEGKELLEDGQYRSFRLKFVQYFDEVRVKITSEEYVSESLISRLKREPNGLFLYVMYRSKKSSGVSSKEDIAYGTMIIRCDPDVLTGEFFNSNGERKTIELYRI